MEIFVGTFNEKQLINGDDKKAIKEVKEKGVKVMKVWLTDKF